MPTVIRTKGNPILHAVAEPVPDKAQVKSLIHLMWSVMYENKGIGLAAPQIGDSVRVIVVDANGFKQEIINPVIVKRYGGKHRAREGCLSYPGASVLVVRDKQIIVEGFDQDWKPIRRKLKGLAARCVQHEVDHLDGITIA